MKCIKDHTLDTKHHEYNNNNNNIKLHTVQYAVVTKLKYSLAMYNICTDAYYKSIETGCIIHNAIYDVMYVDSINFVNRE